MGLSPKQSERLVTWTLIALPIGLVGWAIGAKALASHQRERCRALHVEAIIASVDVDPMPPSHREWYLEHCHADGAPR